jgi:hypothetical protein
MNILPEFVTEAVRHVIDLRDKVDAVKPEMENCVKLIGKLSKFSHEEILIMLHCELSKDAPRAWVIDKLHARTCKLTRREQKAELSKIVKLK